jgi:hypothetical protein
VKEYFLACFSLSAKKGEHEVFPYFNFVFLFLNVKKVKLKKNSANETR